MSSIDLRFDTVLVTIVNCVILRSRVFSVLSRAISAQNQLCALILYRYLLWRGTAAEARVYFETGMYFDTVTIEYPSPARRPAAATASALLYGYVSTERRAPSALFLVSRLEPRAGRL